ncbi:MAG: ABC transporter permease [Acidimicrobiia bacterium]
MTESSTSVQGSEQLPDLDAEAGDQITRFDRRPAWIRGSLKRFTGAVVAFFIIATIWHFALVWSGTESYIFPKPMDVLEAGFENRSLLIQSAWRTAQAATTGLVVAVIGGVLAAIVLHSSRLIERSLLPYAVLLQTTPIVAIAPVIVIWMGPGINSIAIIAFIISFFPMLSNTLVGLHSVDPERRNAFRLYHASRLQRLRKLEFPTALPFILAGARISAGLSVIGAIVGEFVAGIGGGRGGLGYVITVSARQLETGYLFAGAFVGSLMGIAFYAAIGLATRLLLGNWHESQVPEATGPRTGG